MDRRGQKSKSGTSLDDSVDNIDLKFGYTLGDLKRMASFAASDCWWAASLPWGDRVDLALSALAERIYSAAEEPSRAELRNVAKDGINAVERKDLRHHGVDRDTGQLRRNFARYWSSAQGVPSPEEAIIEPLALEQIWHELPKTLRIALQALADHGSNPEAARALGISTPVLATRVSRARAMFLRLWHKGEEPSQLFSRHRPRDPGALNNAPATTSIAVRAQYKERTTRETDRPLYGRARRAVLPVSDAHLAGRHFRDGATLTELAREYNASRYTISRRIQAVADTPYTPAVTRTAAVTIPAAPEWLPGLRAGVATALDGAGRAEDAKHLAVALAADAIRYTTHRITLRVRRADAICLELHDTRRAHPRIPALPAEVPDPAALAAADGTHFARFTTRAGLTVTRVTLPEG